MFFLIFKLYSSYILIKLLTDPWVKVILSNIFFQSQV